MSTVDGLHVPVMLSVDVVGSVGTVPPAHTVSDVPKLNVGVMFGLIVTLNVVGRVQPPPAGVNV